MSNFRFLKFRVYQEAELFNHKILLLTKTIPKEYDYLKNQLRRASLSIMLNIAEGAGKSSDKEFNRYIQNSLGSVNESAACLDVLRHEKIIGEQTANELLTLAEHLKDSLGAFSRKLKS